MHTTVVDRLNWLLILAVGDLAVVQTQRPVRLSERSEPQPDLSLLRPRAAAGNPTPPTSCCLSKCPTPQATSTARLNGPCMQRPASPRSGSSTWRLVWSRSLLCPRRPWRIAGCRADGDEIGPRASSTEPASRPATQRNPPHPWSPPASGTRTCRSALSHDVDGAALCADVLYAPSRSVCVRPPHLISHMYRRAPTTRRRVRHPMLTAAWCATMRPVCSRSDST